MLYSCLLLLPLIPLSGKIFARLSCPAWKQSQLNWACNTVCIIHCSLNLCGFFFVFRVYVLFCFLVLVVSTNAVNCLERLLNDLLCVKWDIKPYTLNLWLIIFVAIWPTLLGVFISSIIDAHPSHKQYGPIYRSVTTSPWWYDVRASYICCRVGNDVWFFWVGIPVSPMQSADRLSFQYIL